MTFTEMPLAGAFVIDIERHEDERGFFARTFDAAEFERRGLVAPLAEFSTSYNARAGTLRGMHFQRPPHGEHKLIRCTRGAVFDVIVDVRADSPTFCAWHGLELTQDNGRLLYVPEGFAHGFQTLLDDTELHYQISAPFCPDAAAGVRWDDPTFGIQWPEAERTISERDLCWPNFHP